jgi:hypothetical protein
LLLIGKVTVAVLEREGSRCTGSSIGLIYFCPVIISELIYPTSVARAISSEAIVATLFNHGNIAGWPICIILHDVGTMVIADLVNVSRLPKGHPRRKDEGEGKRRGKSEKLSHGCKSDCV